MTHLLKLLHKMCKYEMDPANIVEDTVRAQFCPQTDRRTDGRTIGQGETSIPPFQLCWSRGYYKASVPNFCPSASFGGGLGLFFFSNFLQFHFYNSRFKTGGLTTFLTEFWTLIRHNNLINQIRLQTYNLQDILFLALLYDVCKVYWGNLLSCTGEWFWAAM